MKYRMYSSQITIGITFLIALGLSGCAYTPSKQQADRKPDSMHSEEPVEKENRVPARFDGREPASMKGDFTWLNEVESEFGRVAAEASSRVVASQNKHEMLMKQKDWAFSYLPKTNHFYVNLQGVQYQMVQTKIDDGERFSFAAIGQQENPVTFAVGKSSGRNVASGESCTTEISYWSKKTNSYVTDHKSLSGKACLRMMGLLKEYVP